MRRSCHCLSFFAICGILFSACNVGGTGKVQQEGAWRQPAGADADRIHDADMVIPEGLGSPFPDPDKDISFRIEGDSIKAATALEASGTYLWYLGTYTEQDFDNLADDTILDLYDDRLYDDGKGKSVTLSAQGSGQLGLALLILDENNKVSHKFFQPVVVGKTDRVFLHTHQHGPDSNPNQMYFALRVKGSSSQSSFREEYPDGYAYARDLHFQVYADKKVSQQYINFNGAEVDALRSKYGICVDGYNDRTGFANEAGTSFDFPFYFGYDDFRVAMNGSSTLKYEFEAFAVRDTTIEGIFGAGFDYPAFITMLSSERLIIEIPLNEYNSKVHRNIALLTVDFKDFNAAGKANPTITLDGFVGK